MSRALLPATVAGVFLAALAAIVVLFVRWAGTIQVLAPMLRHPPAVAMALASLAAVALSAWIAAALRGGGMRRRLALRVGWLAAAPGLIAIAALAAEVAGLRSAAVAAPAWRALAPLLDPLVRAALLLPFSAGPLVFAAGFALAMIASAAARAARGPRRG